MKKLKKEQGIGSDSEEGEEKGFNLFKMNLQQEDIGQTYDQKMASATLDAGGAKGMRGKNVENIKKRDYKTGV